MCCDVMGESTRKETSADEDNIMMMMRQTSRQLQHLASQHFAIIHSQRDYGAASNRLGGHGTTTW